jgi:hypothetical protein
VRSQHPSADSQNLPFFSDAPTIPLKRVRIGAVKRPATKNLTNPAYAPCDPGDDPALLPRGYGGTGVGFTGCVWRCTWCRFAGGSQKANSQKKWEDSQLSAPKSVPKPRPKSPEPKAGVRPRGAAPSPPEKARTSSDVRSVSSASPKIEKAPQDARPSQTLARPERFELPPLRIEVCVTP